MSTLLKGNFIKFSMEQYFGICSVMYAGENPRKRGRSNSGDEDDDNEEKLGQRFHWTTRDEIQKFGTK
jgi:Zn-finger domain-containing protein